MPARSPRITKPVTYLSAYRLMWMLVLFDLPVMTKGERKAASEFRTGLLDRGFTMAQYSVYYKLLSGKEAVESMVKALRHDIPKRGKVEILCITDRQYEDIIAFEGGSRCASKKTPDQLQLF